MSSPLIYSFRTNKHLAEFRKAGVDIFVFGKLKEDLIEFQTLVEKLQPTTIVGLTEVKTSSRIETKAINSFGKIGKVHKGGKDSYPLYVPTRTPFKKSKTTTATFCNWTMYKISEYIESKGITASFIHFNKADLPIVFTFIQDK